MANDRIIEIKSRRNGWIRVILLSVNKGGTITINVKGSIVTRKIKHVRWGPTERIAKTQGFTVDKPHKDKRFKTRRNRRKFKKRKIFKSSKPGNAPQQSRGRGRRVTFIAGHRVSFL